MVDAEISVCLLAGYVMPHGINIAKFCVLQPLHSNSSTTLQSASAQISTHITTNTVLLFRAGKLDSDSAQILTQGDAAC